MKYRVINFYLTILGRIKLFLFGDKSGVSIWWLNDRMPLLDDVSKISFDGFENSSSNVASGMRIYQELVNDESVTNFPKIWNAGANFTSFLFSYVSEVKPKVIVETGVANGITTLCIASAIDYSECSFHSFDINLECSKVNQDSKNWTFHHLENSNSNAEFIGIINGLPEVDLWIHDSNHHYNWQKFEYELAFKKLSENGVLISDDVDFSKAWGELSEIAEVHYLCAVLDSRKCFGIAQKRLTK